MLGYINRRFRQLWHARGCCKDACSSKTSHIVSVVELCKGPDARRWATTGEKAPLQEEVSNPSQQFYMQDNVIDKLHAWAGVEKARSRPFRGSLLAEDLR